VSDRDEGFLSRWSRRKAQLRSGVEVEPVPAAMPDPSPPSPAMPTPAVETRAEAPIEAPPLPTMDDVAALTRESDYSRFVMPGVDEGVKSAALKKLFSDPHFNLMDGLDTYIDDYNTPDPIPLAMLRKMNQSKFLRLFEHEERDAERDDNQPPATTPPPEPIADDHADLRLQQDDAAGRPGPDEGAGA
jgi:hypothetical protein